MAASIYATPPPDLSSEDTALSDVSNASSLNNRSSSNSNSNVTTNNNNSTSCNNTTTSNNNTTNTNPVANTQKRAINEVLASSASQASPSNPHTPKQSRSVSPKTSNGGSVTSAAITLEEPVDSTIRDEGTPEDDADMSTTPIADDGAAAAMAAMTAAANAAAMQLQFLEAINDAAKKRRKQNNPSRVGAQAAAAAAAAAALSLNEGSDGALINAAAEAIMADKNQFGGGSMTPTTLPIDYDDKLSKMFLPKSIEQLKETFELLQQKQQRFGNISPDTGAAGPEESFSSSQLVKPKTEIVSEMKTGSNEPVSDECSPKSHQLGEELTNPYQTFCKTCGENFETEFKLGLHMLQEHQNDETEYENTNRAVDQGQQKADLIPYDMLSSVNVKMERPDYENSTSPPAVNTAANQIENHNANLLSNGKEPWLNTMPGMGFPFPPEAAAAAALSAGGYLPLLGMPGFPTVDGMNRPPIRIFNPEAYCDLCNKEFCNKYFLKTHRANKHGIYDPAGSTGGEGGANTTGGNISAMTQMLQLQMQQQQQQQQSMQHLQQKQQMALEEAQKQQISSQQAINGASSQQLTPPAPPPVYCDVCSKRFTNVFAMRRHRAKAHDQQRRSPGESTNPTPPPLQSSVPISKSDTPTSVAQNESKHDLSKISSPTDSEAKQFQMPDGFRQDFTLEQEEVSFTPQPRKLSPQSQQQAREANFSHDKLRRLGVVNPEAFCEICCKEYCNKYFLRTHKWKRHGIFVPPDDLKDEQLQFAQKMAWPFMGLPGMPLNLMMANDKALMAQRMFAAATSSVSTAPIIGTDDAPQHVAKRIKLEQDDEEVSKANDENQENKCLSGRQSAEQPQQQAGSHSVASTPEPQKILAESYNSGANMPTSPETAVGLQNLQKLQSMIQQLNDLNGKRTMGCHICGRDMENQYALQVHMMTDHAGLLEGSGTLPLNFQQHLFQQQQQMQAQQQQQVLKHSPSGSPGVIPSLNEMRCNQCDRDFANIQEFKQHIAEVHLLPGSPLRDGFATPERPINPNAASMGSRPPYTITPTSSYCEICNKELCNKYFMKTHMQRMHGIEIENGAQIGGVVCNICNKELCSKYFLRVHKQNTHGIVDESAPLPQPRQNGLSFDSQQQQQQQQSSAETDLNRGLNLSPFGSGNSGDSKSDYANYTEVCVICTRRFRSAKWLRAHLQSDHGTAGIEKLRELEQQYGPLSKSSSPTLKIPNGSANAGSNANNMNTATGALSNPANIAQALQNLNAQHLLGNMPKNILPGMFGAATEQSHSTPRLQEYQCSICPFTTPYYAFLFIHERSHTLLGGAGDLNATASGQLIPGSGIKDEINGGSETKSKSDSTNTPMTDKSTLLSIAQTNSMTTMECGRVEPTNLSTRSTTPSGSASKSKSTKENQAQRSTKQIEAKESRKEVITTKSFAHIKLEKTRTIATSPISTTTTSTFAQVALNDLAEKCGKVASYAVPKGVTGDGLEDGEPQMQAFVLEIQREREMDTMTEAASAAGSAEESSNRFVPAIVYLPVRKRISGPVTVSFNLTPA
ncbi:uncharacterized protein LOC120778742 [Bactrocera tryoni]|uniref:uncharacterized protein LOC120778742 n=1 Tax=Bactrocera tryoni TaxID=59916 RepID=UPI001A98AA5E|nr:uncharacterized protein LOC120778742 [Bactrocera tryoni]